MLRTRHDSGINPLNFAYGIPQIPAMNRGAIQLLD